MPQVMTAQGMIPQYVSAGMMPQAMMAQPGEAGLYQQLSLMRQNMDMLMNQAVMGQQAAQPAPQVNTQVFQAKVDQLSESFKEEEQKMETRVGTLEGENKDMKDKLDSQASEIQELQKEANDNKEELQKEASDNKELRSEVQKLSKIENEARKSNDNKEELQK